MTFTGRKISSFSSIVTPDGNDLFVLSQAALSNKKITYTDLVSSLSIDLGTSNVLINKGDIMTHDGSSVTVLPVGLDNQYLTSISGDLSWNTFPNLLVDPTSINGDIVTRTGGSLASLPIGNTGQVLTVSQSLIPEWSSLSSYIDPLIDEGDILYRGSLSTVRLAKGIDGEVLTLSGGIPTWSSSGIYVNPLTTDGDILYLENLTSSRLGIGNPGQFLVTSTGNLPAWEDRILYLDPLSQDEDLLIRKAGATTSLIKGTNGQVLTVSSGSVNWANPISYFDDPTSNDGDMLRRKAGVLSTLPIGANGQVLTVSGGNVQWGSASLVDTTAIHNNVNNEINLITEKVSPVSGDHLIIEDSEDFNSKKKVQIGNLGNSSSVTSGIYSGVPTNLININAITSSLQMYTRIGNTVFVSGIISISASSVGLTSFYFSLPIPSVFNSTLEVSGVMIGKGVPSQGYGTVSTDIGTNLFKMEINSPNTSSFNYHFRATYIVS